MLFVDVATHRVLYRNSQYSYAQVKKKMKIKQNLRKLLKQNRGMVGIEAAIVLISFVIVAAAFSFMVVNMGLFATQRSKETIQNGVTQSSTPLVISGDIWVRANATAPFYVDAIVIPLQTIGVRYVPMDVNATQVTLTVANRTAFADVYAGVAPDNAIDNPYNNTFTSLVSQVTTLGGGGTQAMLFLGNSNNNTSLDSTEKGYLIFNMNTPDRATHGEHIYVQIAPAQGAPLSLEFVVPPQLAEGWSTVGS
jgi:flagellin FlaB